MWDRQQRAIQNKVRTETNVKFVWQWNNYVGERSTIFWNAFRNGLRESRNQGVRDELKFERMKEDKQKRKDM